MKIDLHMHTNLHSPCSQTPPEVQIQAAIDHGLDGVAITDHGAFLSPEDRDALQAKFPKCRIFRGAELWVDGDDVIFIGGPGGPFPRITSETAKNIARETGALVILPHPLLPPSRKIQISLDAIIPDAIEVASMSTDKNYFSQTRDVARKYGMKLVGVSDAHDPKYVGMFHVDLDRTVRDEAELATEIRAGRFRIGANYDCLERRYKEMIPEVVLAETVFREGGTEQDFLARGGKYAFILRRLQFGGSWLPNLEVIGLRPSDSLS
ncbi:MAG: PHP domain-containing protein [Planctomycetes bacterium]|nr:PHP domain-containing protein [Planctomycetota bacterium]